MNLRGHLTAVVSLLVIASAIAARPSRASHDYYGVVSRGTTAVAVGDSGRILYSTQGPHITWFGTQTVVPVNLRAVTTTTTGYAAVAEQGKFYRNSDGTGVLWTPFGSRTRHDLFGAAHVGSYLMAVGDSGAVVVGAFQSDQNPWALVDSVQTGQRLRAVGAGQSAYVVAVGDSGTVVWGTAANPEIWRKVSSIPVSQDLHGIAEGPNSRFWAVGAGGTILRSLGNPDAAWEQVGEGVTTEDLNAVAFFGLIGVAVGDNGTVLYSNGGSVWALVDAPTTKNLHGVAYTGSGGGGGFVAVGDQSTVIWSATGINWQAAVVPVRAASWGTIRGRWR